MTIIFLVIGLLGFRILNENEQPAYEHPTLTLLEAYHVARVVLPGPEFQLLHATSVDKEPMDPNQGTDGRRNHWTFIFGVIDG